MKAERLVAVVCAAWLALAAPMEGQDPPIKTEQEAVQALSSSDWRARERGLSFAWRLGSEAGTELRAALIKAAMEEVRGETDLPDTGETVFETLTYYADTLAPLREPGAVPFFLEMLKYGTPAAVALADIGAAALPGVLKMVADSRNPHYVRSDAMDALRFMVEDGWPGPEELAAIQDVARGCLTGKQHCQTIREAMFLAVALGDPELLAIVATLASDRSAVEALTDEPAVIQKAARDLLSGTLVPFPERRPWSEGG